MDAEKYCAARFVVISQKLAGGLSLFVWLLFSLMKLKEEHDATKTSYQMLQEEYQKLKKQHVQDNGECSLEATDIWSYVILVSNLFRLADAAKKAFDAKVKENDDFV